MDTMPRRSCLPVEEVLKVAYYSVILTVVTDNK